MLKLSKKVEYALIVLLELGARDTFEAVTTKSLSGQYKIPYDLLGKVLQALSRKALVQSVKGVKGGYMMTRALEQINVRQVIEAIDGPISLTSCVSSERGTCEQRPRCTIKTPMELIQSELNDFFRNISLDDLRDRTEHISQSLMYTIS